MKKIIVVLFCLITFCVAHAQEKIISISTLRIGSVDIGLPKVMNDQGLLCVSYIKKTSKSEDSTLNVQIGQYCGKPVHFTNNLAHDDVFPEGLQSLVTVTNGDLVHQEPKISDTRSTQPSACSSVEK
jgi:hypothetical protein